MRRPAGAMLIALLLLLAPGPVAAAQPTGGFLVVPGTGTDLTSIRLRTGGGCPQEADAYYARLTGSGFPNGLLVTTNISAGISYTGGFDVYFEQTMRDFADLNGGVTLGGRYDLTVYCIESFRQTVFAEFTGAMEFLSPTEYTALGAALPVGAVPEPLRMGETGGSAQIGPLPDASVPLDVPTEPGAPGDLPADQAAGPGPAPAVEVDPGVSRTAAGESTGTLPTIVITVLICVPLVWLLAMVVARRRSP